ncbi:MAG: hypothetical protein WD716_12920 [Fimbriimonadaceae bacterium]
MPAYYPAGDHEFLAFVDVIIANIGDVMTALALPATFDDDIVAKRATYATDLTTHVASQTQAVADRTAKDGSKDALIAAVTLAVNQLRPNPLFVGDIVASLGLQEYDTTPTAIVPGEEVPTVIVDTSAPQHHQLKFLMLTAGGGLVKAKPSWARATRIIYAIVASGAPCPPIEEMDFLVSDSNSPYDWDIPGTEVGKDIWYRAAFETPRGELGNWSDPAKGTVTG